MKNDKVKTLTYMALMAALALVATILIRIPVPATQGYVHFGDTILILSVIILGKKNGAIAGALGEALADVLGGYAVFAPVTFVAKLLMGLLIGVALEMLLKNKNKNEKHFRFIAGGIAMVVVSCAAMVGSYYIAESVMYGSFVIPLVEIPANIVQFSVSAVLAGLVGTLLAKSPAKSIIKLQK